MPESLDNHFRFNATALSLRAERQKILASNIANADTPNYKARDIEFSKVLQQTMATAAGNSSAPMKTSHPAHLPLMPLASGALAQPLLQSPLYRVPHQDSIDGNTVELDAERAQFADNALRYEAVLSEVNSKIKNLSAVLQGQ